MERGKRVKTGALGVGLDLVATAGAALGLPWPVWVVVGAIGVGLVLYAALGGDKPGDEEPPPQRTGYRLKGSTLHSRGGSIRNQDVSVDATDSDIDVEDTEVE